MNQRIVHNAPVIEFATLIVLTHYALIPVDTLDGEEYSATTNGLSAQPPDYISARRTSLSKTGQGIEDARGLVPHRIFTTIQVIGAKYKVADIGSLRICNPSEHEGEVKRSDLLSKNCWHMFADTLKAAGLPPPTLVNIHPHDRDTAFALKSLG